MRRPSWGFTLTELLVVMGILVLVAGIVLATMAPLREKGRQGACISNLRQIHLALAVYRHDYEGDEPSGPMEYWRLGLPPPSAFGKYGNGGEFAARFVKDPRLWTCPSDPCTFMARAHPECRAEPRSCCTSYTQALWWNMPTPGIGLFPDAVAECGQRLPLYFCRHHGMEQGVSTYAIILRWNGQVKGQYMQVPRTPCLD